ncbi:MAG: tetratricopeptide repeat protein [Chitinivibrionales bacterium]|nr:tetratricopeptide repeat protein [Chitinivibrionales bacterium]
MKNINQLLHSAVALHRQGDLDTASALYLEILRHEPCHCDSLHLLSKLLFQKKDPERALIYARRAMECSPENPEYHNFLGVILQSTGDIPCSVEAFSAALRYKPDYAEACFNRGNSWRIAGEYEQAVASYQAAISIRPDYCAAHSNCGAALKALGRMPEALYHFREAVRIKPDLAEAHNNLGLALFQTGKNDEAIDHFHKALLIRPTFAEIFCNLGKALEKKGQYKEAEAHFLRALSFNRTSVNVLIDLGNLYARMKKFKKARDAFFSALKYKPDCTDAYYGLGTLMREWNYLDEAASCFTKALQHNPRSVMALCNYGETLQESGLVDKAESLYDRALDVDPGCDVAMGNKIYCMNYNPRYSPGEIFRAHVTWAKTFARPPAVAPRFANDRSPERRLRIGYVSPDFCSHPASYFFQPLFTCRDSGCCELFCYAVLTRKDSRTAFFKSHADCFRDISALSNKQFAATVQSDKIDILVDLAGHTAGNRLRAIALKPAPVLISFLGYPNTTGMSSIDYRFTDALADPPGSDGLFTETLVRLDRGFCCYAPPENAPRISPLPAIENGYITFGSTHSLARLNPDVLSLWAELLKAVPGSRLYILRNSLSESAQARFRDSFEHRGIAASRILLRKKIPEGGHLAAYHSIDIALDTFPWSGHTTACEALWMGVPVTTLTGNRHAGRMVASVLTRIGLKELNAKSPGDYIRIARELAENKDRLNRLRHTLRDSLAGSPLCDGQSFTREIEQEYRAMWRRWCRNE